MGRAFEYRRATKEKRWDKMSKLFPKLGKAITMAAKEGGVDPDMNATLRTAIRNAKAQNMPKDNIDAAIKRANAKDADDFSEGWDPYSIHSIEEFKEKIKTSGHEYWGDHILLQVLIKILRINVFILNCNSLTNDHSVYNTLNDYNPESGSIFLIYEDMCHFKLLGYFNNKIRSYFTDSSFPYELRKLYRLKN